MSRSTATPNSSTRRAAALSSRRAPASSPSAVRARASSTPRLRSFVRRLDLAPDADPLPQGGDRLLGVAAMERQMPARDGRRGRRPGGAEPSGQLLQLGDALGRRLLVAHRQARRDVHGEEEDPALPSEEARVRERAAEAPHRRPGITLRQQQATPPRLAVVAQGDGLGECLLGTVQVAATHPDLDQLAVPPACAVPVDPQQLLARLQDPLLRLRQLTVEPVDLALVEPAQPRVARDRLALAVAGRHLGPLGGPPPVAERSADRDHRAVHVAGMDGGDPGSHGQRRRLVDQRQHLTDLTCGGGHVGQPLHRHRLHARTAHPPGDRPRFEQRGPRPLGVSTLHQREGQRPPRLRVLGALRRLGQVLGGSDVAGEGDGAVEHHRVLAGLLQGHAGGTGSSPASVNATSARSRAFKNPAGSPSQRHDQASRSRSSAPIG